MKTQWLIGGCLFFAQIAWCGDLDTVPAMLWGNDTVFVKQLPELEVKPEPRTEFDSRRQRRYYGRLLRDVRLTLPYAKMAASLLIEVNDSLQKIEDKRAKERYIESIEDTLFAEYEPVLRKMSIRQGRIMIKLMDRECQMTSYELVRFYKGGFSAFFWQGVARVFGSDLKSSYDAKGEDALMEEVVQLVEYELKMYSTPFLP